MLSSIPSAFLVVITSVIFAVIFLIWYALRRNDEVTAKLAHGKTVFELRTKRRRG